MIGFLNRQSESVCFKLYERMLIFEILSLLFVPVLANKKLFSNDGKNATIQITTEMMCATYCATIDDCSSYLFKASKNGNYVYTHKLSRVI